jgi:hypothetical protein
MQIHHDDPLAGNYDVIKTLELLLRNYYFPDIHAYDISSCDLCSRGKTPFHLKHGEFALFLAPSGPWKELSCDFVTDLRVSKESS